MSVLVIEKRVKHARESDGRDHDPSGATLAHLVINFHKGHTEQKLSVSTLVGVEEESPKCERERRNQANLAQFIA